MSFNFTFTKKVFNTIRLTYKPNSMWDYSKLDDYNNVGNEVTYNTFRLDQDLTLGFSPVKLWDLKIDAKHSFSHQDNSSVDYFFCDMNIRHSFKKSGIDLSLDLNNIFNVKDYKLYSILNNQVIVNQYNLRGRIALLRLDWYF